MPSLADSYIDTVAAAEEDRLWGLSVTIKRGSVTTAGVTMQKDSGERKINLDDGSYIQYYACEWTCTKARYLISGAAVRPKSGDRIIESDGTEWELQPIEDLSEVVEPPGGLEWLLRTKRVKASV